MKFLTMSSLILIFLYGMVFAVGDAVLVHDQASIWIGLAFAVFFIGLQYLCAPWIIEWVLTIYFDDRDIPEANRAFVEQLCKQRSIPQPKLGLIESGTPNAFSFGRVRSDSRVVITRGLLNVLTPEETNAVLAHEIGHIEHYDFAVMAIAALAPLLLYQIYIFTRRNRNTQPVAAVAYACYLLGQYIVLLLNHTREYWADHYCAQVTGDPNELSSALVKIAYGMVKSDGEYRESLTDKSADKKAFARQHQVGNAVALMGISNMQSGAALALAMANPQQAAAVMRWDLVNPWSRVYQLSSTHPLTALRVQALNSDARAMGRVAEYPLPTERQLQWGAFPLEFAVWSAPFVCAALLIFDGFTARFARDLHIAVPAHVNAWLFIALGITWMARIAWRYRGDFAPTQVQTLLEDMAVSQMTPRAVRIEGTIVGNGIPGAFWSPDLVLRDQTGIIFILYRSSIPFARLVFAFRGVHRFIGEQVVVEGWYRRGLRPYIEFSTLRATVTKVSPGSGPTSLFGASSQNATMEPETLVQRSYSRWIQFSLSVAATTLGILWLTGSF